MTTLYDSPTYYDIAFSYRDITEEVDVLEACIKRFSGVPVKSVLEIACGNTPHMPELAKRGYRYTGLDQSEAMLAFSKDRAARLGIDAQFVRSSMAGFKINPPVDFACIMLGSLYIADTAELIGHFDSLAASLKRGGLYFMDACLRTWVDPAASQTWEMERDGIKVKTVWKSAVADPLAQTYLETIDLDVDDHGRHVTISERFEGRVVYPQDFLLYIKQRGDFEFVGWWNNWDLDQPLDGLKGINRAITVIRRV